MMMDMLSDTARPRPAVSASWSTRAANDSGAMCCRDFLWRSAFFRLFFLVFLAEIQFFVTFFYLKHFFNTS
jgi:hypothetical protein